MNAKSPRAIITASVLVWARESARLDVDTAAKAAGTSSAKLRSWESGDEYPTMRQLRLLANKYKRPTALFYLPEPPKDFQPLKDFRRLPGVVSGIMSYRLSLEIRQAQERREAALDLFAELGEEPPPLAIPKIKRSDPETFAKKLREKLNVSVSDQASFGNGDSGFRAWRTCVESAGVLVFQTSEVDRNEARGFAVPHDVLPVIAVNNQDFPNAKTFGLVHELAHVALREAALTDFRLTNADEARPPEAREIEVFCNAVAAAVLMPKAAFLSHRLVVDQQDHEGWSDGDLDAIARDFTVSAEAVTRRLLTFGLTTERFYRRKRDEFNLRVERLLAERKERQRLNKGGPEPYRMTLSTMGSTFSRLVVQTYHSGRITLADATDYLNVRAPQFSKIERAAFGVGV